MTRTLLALFLLFCFSIAAAQEAVVEFTDHPARVVTNIGGLNVRSSPAIETDNIVGRLQPGQQVHVLAREGDWQQVRSEDGLLGWSHSDYLIDMPPRQIGETRKFRIKDSVTNRLVTVDAELRHISKHSYIYAIRRGGRPTISDVDLRWLGEEFDARIYPETIALWPVEPKPSHEGDEHIVILLTQDYGIRGVEGGWYAGREAMPGEVNPYGNRVGFLGITWWTSMNSDFAKNLTGGVTAHELQHLIQHHVDGDEKGWVNEGLSSFTGVYLGYNDETDLSASNFLSLPQTPLNHFTGQIFHYGAGLLFTTYIYERFGLAALQAFAARPENGFDALDAQFADMDIDLDANTFFADWVLANYLRDERLGDGRYGYPLLSKVDLLPPVLQGRVTQLPALIQDHNNQYATDYYELALPAAGQSRQLELELQLSGAASQDAWLQMAQVQDDQVIVQRFRASDLRGRTIRATLEAGVDQAFLALSPFTPSDRDKISPTNYTLTIRAVDGTVTAPDTDSLSTESSDRVDSIELMRIAAAGDAFDVGLILLAAGNDLQQTDVTHQRSALHMAAAAGHDDVVALLLLTEIDIHARDADGKTALMLAEEAGHNDVVKLLRFATVEYDKRSTQEELSEEEKALLAAASAGNLKEVKRLIDSGVALDVRDAEGRTVLLLARQAGQNSVARLLSYYLAEAGERSMQGFPPEEVNAFHAAARAGNLTEMERLLAAGIYVDVRDEDHQTALMLAVQSGARDITLRLLLAGANPLRSSLFHAIQNGESDIATMLLLNNVRFSNKESLKHRDEYDRTALHLAAEYGRTDIVRLLLTQANRGLDVNARALYSSKTALFPATRLGRVEIVELLLAAGTDPNLSDSGPARPLNFAILFERTPIVELLLNAGADPNWQNKSGRSALHYVCWVGHARITELLLACRRRPDAGG